MNGTQRRGAGAGTGGEQRRGGREDRRGRDAAAEKGKSQYLERVVAINRVAKGVQGGRRFSFTAPGGGGDRGVPSGVAAAPAGRLVDFPRNQDGMRDFRDKTYPLLKQAGLRDFV